MIVADEIRSAKAIRMAVVLVTIMTAILLFMTGCTTTNPGLEDISNTTPNHYACTYDGVRHDFIVDLPEDPVGSPLVLMLPGAGGTAESFRLDTRFHETACPHGYTVVYVTGAPEPGDPTSPVVWNHEGSGSGNDDVGFLTSLVEFIHETYLTDHHHCFAAGFSNGAFMCHRLALEASETFQAVISVAGTMSCNTWKNRPADCPTSLLQIAGEKDDVIPRLGDGSARYSKFPAIEDVIAYYSDGLETAEVLEIGKGSTLTEYKDDSDNQVWFLLVEDGRHSWSAESVTEIDTNRIILDFLESET